MGRSLALMVTTVLAAAAIAAAQEANAPLRVYLPRSIRVQTQTLKLDQVCMVRCDDAALAEAANAVELGRAPLSKEQLVVGRSTIMSRLVAGGIASSRIEFTGCPEVSVSRDEKVVSSEQIVESAEGLVGKSLAGGTTYRLSQKPAEMILPAPREDIVLKPGIVKNAPAGSVKVEVRVVADGVEMGSREVIFRVGYTRKEAVATKDIAVGAIVTPENAQVRTVACDEPADEWVSPFGRPVASAVAAGGVIASEAMQKPRLSIAAALSLVRRNQTVVMKIATPAMTISGVGLALQDGKAGEIIKVQNADSKRVVTARVGFDGTVAPVYEEKQ